MIAQQLKKRTTVGKKQVMRRIIERGLNNRWNRASLAEFTARNHLKHFDVGSRHHPSDHRTDRGRPRFWRHRGSRGGDREDRLLRGAGVVRHIADCERHARRFRPAFIVAFSKDWTASHQDRQ